MISWREWGNDWFQGLADALRWEFYNLESPGLCGWGKVLLSLAPRQIAIWLGNDVTVTTANNTGIEVSKKISCLAWNGLFFHEKQARKQNRPGCDDQLPGGGTRVDKMMQVVKKANPDIAFFTEVHRGQPLEKRLIEELTKQGFHNFAGNTLPQTLFFGAGIFCATKYKEVTFKAYPFKARGGADGLFVRKGLLVATIKDDEGNAVAHIAGSHFQSGNSTKRSLPPSLWEMVFGTYKTCSQIRQAQAEEASEILKTLKKKSRAKIALLIGDLNSDRLNLFSKYPQLIIEDLSTEQLKTLITDICSEGIEFNESTEGLKAIIQDLHPGTPVENFQLSGDVRAVLKEIIRYESAKPFHDKISDSIKGAPGLLNPKNTGFKYGFGNSTDNQLTAKTPTCVGITKLGIKDGQKVAIENGRPSALDGAVGLPGNYGLIVEGIPGESVEDCKKYEASSDHVPFVAVITRGED